MVPIEIVTAEDWANYWYHIRKVNVFPFDTKNRKPVIDAYTNFQNKRIPIKTFEQWKKDGLFDKGMAVFPGKIYSDENDRDLYLVALDFDKKQGLVEFCNIGGKKVTLTDLSRKTIVEGHDDDQNRIHIYFLSPIPFPNKGSDSIIGIEVKSKGEHGIMFCSNSPHKNGLCYRILGTTEPARLSNQQATEMIQHLNGICEKYGIVYVDKQSSIHPKLRMMIKSLKIEETTNLTLYQGERHDKLLPIANSILFSHLEENSENVNELKNFFMKINKIFCFPDSLPEDEIDNIWNSALNYVKENKDFSKSTKESSKLERERQLGLIEQATETILNSNQFVTLQESKEILHYLNGVYVAGGEIIIEKEAERIFGYRLANKHLTEIKGHIMRQTYHERKDFDKELYIINLQNGLYDIKKNILNPHSPDYLSIVQIPIIYDPKLKPQLFGKFLKDVLYPSDIRTAIEAMSYTFWRDYPYEYYFKLYGYGSNGKSVFTALLTSLHGKRNVSNVSVKSLLDNRFALADLEFKNLNIDSEYSDATVKDTSILKKLTGGRKQLTRIERKNQHAYDTNLYAKLFFNANSLNEHIEKTNADYRREVIITFPNTFEGKKDDTQLQQKLEKQEEISAVFNILMIALRRIIKNKGIHMNEKTIEERRKKSERVADPIKSFIEDAVAEDSTEADWIAKTDFHIAYMRFCKRYKIAIKPIEIFSKDLGKIKRFSQQKKTINGERKMGWLGIRLNPHYLISEEQRLLSDLC